MEPYVRSAITLDYLFNKYKGKKRKESGRFQRKKEQRNLEKKAKRKSTEVVSKQKEGRSQTK